MASENLTMELWKIIQKNNQEEISYKDFDRDLNMMLNLPKDEVNRAISKMISQAELNPNIIGENKGGSFSISQGFIAAVKSTIKFENQFIPGKDEFYSREIGERINADVNTLILAGIASNIVDKMIDKFDTLSNSERDQIMINFEKLSSEQRARINVANRRRNEALKKKDQGQTLKPLTDAVDERLNKADLYRNLADNGSIEALNENFKKLNIIYRAANKEEINQYNDTEIPFHPVDGGQEKKGFLRYTGSGLSYDSSDRRINKGTLPQNGRRIVNRDPSLDIFGGKTFTTPDGFEYGVVIVGDNIEIIGYNGKTSDWNQEALSAIQKDIYAYYKDNVTEESKRKMFTAMSIAFDRSAERLVTLGEKTSELAVAFSGPGAEHKTAEERRESAKKIIRDSGEAADQMLSMLGVKSVDEAVEVIEKRGLRDIGGLVEKVVIQTDPARKSDLTQMDRFHTMGEMISVEDEVEGNRDDIIKKISLLRDKLSKIGNEEEVKKVFSIYKSLLEESKSNIDNVVLNDEEEVIEFIRDNSKKIELSDKEKIMLDMVIDEDYGEDFYTVLTAHRELFLRGIDGVINGKKITDQEFEAAPSITVEQIIVGENVQQVNDNFEKMVHAREKDEEYKKLKVKFDNKDFKFNKPNKEIKGEQEDSEKKKEIDEILKVLEKAKARTGTIVEASNDLNIQARDIYSQDKKDAVEYDNKASDDIEQGE